MRTAPFPWEGRCSALGGWGMTIPPALRATSLYTREALCHGAAVASGGQSRPPYTVRDFG